MPTRAPFFRASALLLLFAAAALAQAPSRADLTRRLVAAAEQRAKVHVRYDPAYVRIAYPGGDVAPDTGVCSDEIIRIYRAVGIDLQKEVHEDMQRNFSAYPSRRLWGRTTPDSNIDHRRVPNLMMFFQRHGESLALSRNSDDYRPGDIVAWDLGGGVTHIGMVVERTSLLGRHEILHNIGRGPQIENVLFDWKIIGHYRYFGG